MTTTTQAGVHIEDTETVNYLSTKPANVFAVAVPVTPTPGGGGGNQIDFEPERRRYMMFITMLALVIIFLIFAVATLGVVNGLTHMLKKDQY